MRRIMKAAVVGAMAAGLLGASASAALADGYELDREETTTNLAQCVVNQEVVIPGPVTVPAGLLGESGLTYTCTGNEAVVVND